MTVGKLESGHDVIPAENGETVVPNDAVDFAPTRGVYVGATGNLRVLFVGGTVVTFVDIAAGYVHPLQITRVYATGTTATSVVVLR